jgi:hypothetical protein
MVWPTTDLYSRCDQTQIEAIAVDPEVVRGQANP